MISSFDLKKLHDYEKKGFVKSSLHPFYNLSIWNYTEIVQYKDKWDDITLNCRALIIKNDTGEVVGRSFPKFFNFEENKHTPTNNFRVFNKADGSLGVLFFYKESSSHPGEWIFTSRGSFISEQATKGMDILKQYYPQYVDLDKSLSYIFEIIYPENRIVVNYGTDVKLIYLSSFETNGTEYFLKEEMRNKEFDVIEEYDLSRTSLKELKAMNIPNKEGFVIRYDSGERVKIKFTDYLKLHKTVTNISNKSIFELCRTGKKLEELLENIPDEFNGWFKNVYDVVSLKHKQIKDECVLYLNDHLEESKKEFFIGINNHEYKSIIALLYKKKFLSLNDNEVDILIYNHIDINSLDIADQGFIGKDKPKKKPTMIFLIGRSGSGKTTWANKFMRNRKDCIRVNRDTIRISLFNLLDERDIGEYYQSSQLKSKEKIVSEIAKSIILNGIRDNMTIIIDNTNLEEEYILENLKLATFDTVVEYKIFGEELSDKELFERVKSREHFKVPLSIIKKQTANFKLLLPKLPQIFSKIANKIEQNPELPKAIVFDIDGTLALNLNGRSPYDMTRLMEDSPNYHIIELAKLLKQYGKKIILCSGRDNSGMVQTIEWMRKHEVEFDELHMRTKGDNRKDCVIKYELWSDICKRYYVENMFDDRNQVVEHARLLGFNVCQVADGNF